METDQHEVKVTGARRIDTLLRDTSTGPSEQSQQNPDKKKRRFLPTVQKEQDQDEQKSYGLEDQNDSDSTPNFGITPPDETWTYESLSHREHEALSSTPDTESSKDELIKIDFKDETLGTIVNHFATIQKRNVIFPPGTDALSQKVTFSLPNEIPLSSIDTYLDVILEIAGYSRVAHGSFYKIVADKSGDKSVNRENLPLYAGASAQTIPTGSERIRAVLYLANLKVPEGTQNTETLTTLLRDVLSTNADLQFDTRSNAIIIADRASHIHAAATLLEELDTINVKEIIRILPLYNTNAGEVAKLLNEFIISAGASEDQARAEAGRYFQIGTKIVPDIRMNSLIIMGREPAVERLREFVRTHIDTPLSSGNSVLHYYELQYLDAQAFAPILEKIVRDVGSSGQSTSQREGGPMRNFEGVLISAEKPEVAEVKKQDVSDSGLLRSSGAAMGTLRGTVYRGGNRLVIAANQTDWRKITKLIEELDKPQLQVVVQTVILDYDANESKILAAQTRNPSWMQLPPGISFQTEMINPTILPSPITVNTTLASDLLQLLSPTSQSVARIITSTTAGVGSTILSLNDSSLSTPGIWSFVQWLNRFGSTRVLSNPFMTIVNNRKGTEEITTSKRAPSVVQTGEGGAITRKIIDYKASLKVTVVPRASSKNRTNLQILIEIEQFIDNAPNQQYNKITRSLETNVNLSNGEMLVLGGLSNNQTSDQDYETPLIGRIPILRWLFSNSTRTYRKTNLVVLISPTIIEPKIRDGLNQFSHDAAEHIHKLLEDGLLLEDLRDPIAQSFFKDNQSESVQLMDQYLSESKGDFVYPPHNKKVLPSTHHCEKQEKETKPSDQKRLSEMRARERSKRVIYNAKDPLSRPSMVDTLQDAKIKSLLALEENPLVSMHHP